MRFVRCPVSCAIMVGMTDPLLPDVVSELALSNAFLGRIIEVCIVTEDCHRTMAGLARLGVGPFRVYTFDDTNLTMPAYRGQVSPFSLKVCFATNEDLTWEIMQPLHGRTIMREFTRQARRKDPPSRVRLQWGAVGSAAGRLRRARLRTGAPR